MAVRPAQSGRSHSSRSARRDYDRSSPIRPGNGGSSSCRDPDAPPRPHRPDDHRVRRARTVVAALRAGAYDSSASRSNRDTSSRSASAVRCRACASRRVKGEQLAVERHLNELEPSSRAHARTAGRQQWSPRALCIFDGAEWPMEKMSSRSSRWPTPARSL